MHSKWLIRALETKLVLDCALDDRVYDMLIGEWQRDLEALNALKAAHVKVTSEPYHDDKFMYAMSKNGVCRAINFKNTEEIVKVALEVIKEKEKKDESESSADA